MLERAACAGGGSQRTRHSERCGPQYLHKGVRARVRGGDMPASVRAVFGLSGHCVITA
jgi:hypothetical protein